MTKQINIYLVLLIFVPQYIQVAVIKHPIETLTSLPHVATHVVPWGGRPIIRIG